MFHCNENKSQNYHNQSIKGISVLFSDTRTASSHLSLLPAQCFRPRQKKRTSFSFSVLSFCFSKLVDQVCSTKYFKVIGLVCWLPWLRATRANWISK